MTMKRCFLSILIAAFAAGYSDAAGSEPERPNILFILFDDLGINDLHCYGRQDHHTPNLDRLAQQGMRFTSAYCASRSARPRGRPSLPARPRRGCT